jgi:hypothetical protein
VPLMTCLQVAGHHKSNSTGAEKDGEDIHFFGTEKAAAAGLSTYGNSLLSYS